MQQKKRRYNPSLAHGKLENPSEAGNQTNIIIQQLRGLLGLLLLVLSIAMTTSLASWNIYDPSLSYANANNVKNILGKYGAKYADLSMQFFGLGSMSTILPIFFWGLLLFLQRNVNHIGRRIIFYIIVVMSFSCLLSLLPHFAYWPLNSGMGGIVGDKLAYILQDNMLTYFGAYYNFTTIAVLTLVFLLSMPIAGSVVWVKPAKCKKIYIDESKVEQSIELCDSPVVEKESKFSFFKKWLKKYEKKAYEEPYFEETSDETVETQLDFLDPSFSEQANIKENLNTKTQSNILLKSMKASSTVNKKTGFSLPHLASLSNAPKQKKGENFSAEYLNKNANKLETVLEEFGVKGKIINAHPGPVVTLYEFEPAPGIKSSRVIGLADDIARSISALSVRVAVVPGRNAIGIEIPNKDRATVYLRSVLESTLYEKSNAALSLALGVNIAGEPVVTDLAKMPHLLVAGTTGSGKSVGINTMILSLLYKLTPEECRFIMVDPKMLELSVYEGIPHLLTPVVTDPKKAIVALKWAVKEMEDRYRKMAKLGVRNIDGFNKRVREMEKNAEPLTQQVQTGFDSKTGKPIFENPHFELKHLPYIVIIIDEMADLMMVAGKEIEGAVQRLAQMARAAGLHVIMATQRPSVDVITGTIKANFPTRISFSVTSKIDSRTILGEQGAEQLLGQGDMLFMMGGGRIQRVHGPFVSDKEVEYVVNHLKLQAAPDYKEGITIEEEEEGEIASQPFDKSDDLYDRAVAVVLRDKKVSTSYIQRRLSIGYNKAATLIERMEEEGLISVANHVGKREILMSDKDYLSEKYN